MKVAIDKNCIDKIDNLKKYDFIYVYESEDTDYLLNLGINCIHKRYIEEVDINLTDYDIVSLKKAKVTDKEWDKLPKITNYNYAIIVPNYNNDRGNYKGKTYLKNCIESILNQTYKNFKLIIVDDMSTDTSVETINSYKDDRITLIKNKRKKYNGGSRNVGIDYALENLTFDYFCFLDSDDWWKDEKVLETINKNLHNHEMMLFGMELINSEGVFMKKIHEYDNYEDFFLSDNKTWCTAWSRVIRKDKIVYFCEDTLMEDRVWSYRQADNVNFENVKNLKRILYVWNRMNTTNSVSIVRDYFWDASAYCHIGHQMQLLTTLKHKEMIPILKQRIEICKKQVNEKIYQQY